MCVLTLSSVKIIFSLFDHVYSLILGPLNKSKALCYYWLHFILNAFIDALFHWMLECSFRIYIYLSFEFWVEGLRPQPAVQCIGGINKASLSVSL